MAEFQDNKARQIEILTNVDKNFGLGLAVSVLKTQFFNAEVVKSDTPLARKSALGTAFFTNLKFKKGSFVPIGLWQRGSLGDE